MAARWLPQPVQDRAVQEARRRVTAAEHSLMRAVGMCDDDTVRAARRDLASAEATLARLVGGDR